MQIWEAVGAMKKEEEELGDGVGVVDAADGGKVMLLYWTQDPKDERTI